MALTPEQSRAVIKLALERAQKGLPPLVPRRTDDDEPPTVSLTYVREILAKRGVPMDVIEAMSRDQLRTEQAGIVAHLKTGGFKHATGDEDRFMKDNRASNDLHVRGFWRRLQWRSRPIAAHLRLGRYRYAVVMLVGIAIGALITVLRPTTTYSDCILKHIDHATSRMAVSVTQRACATKYPPMPGEAGN